MSNDKKNNDKRINLILLKKIGETTLPNSYKISSQELKKKIDKISAEEIKSAFQRRVDMSKFSTVIVGGE